MNHAALLPPPDPTAGCRCHEAAAPAVELPPTGTPPYSWCPVCGAAVGRPWWQPLLDRIVFAAGSLGGWCHLTRARNVKHLPDKDQSTRRHRRKVLAWGAAALTVSALLGRGAPAMALGGEFQVNTTITNNQRNAGVARDSAGDFVVVWQSYLQDGDGYGVYGQRYSSVGVKQSGEFRVNATTTNLQRNPSVAMDSAGDFVVVWQSQGQDGSLYGVYGQRYSSVGVKQGGEFQVNTYTTSSQLNPSVAMDSAGDFVVVWQSRGQDGSYDGVYGQRYSSAGVAQGSEFRVNTYTTSRQLNPSVAMDSAGDFVVAWTSYGQDGSYSGVYGQRYSSAGVAQGAEFQVNTTTTNQQSNPSVAMDSAGDFVVAWQSSGQDGSNFGVYGQQYNNVGAAQGSEFRVNTYTTNRQFNPSVAMDAAGDFVVVWDSYSQDGSVDGVYGQRYNNVGAAQGSEFRVNTTTTNQQSNPSVAMDSAGDVVVAWESYVQDGSKYGVYARQFVAPQMPTNTATRTATSTPTHTATSPPTNSPTTTRTNTSTPTATETVMTTPTMVVPTMTATAIPPATSTSTAPTLSTTTPSSRPTASPTGTAGHTRFIYLPIVTRGG